MTTFDLQPSLRGEFVLLRPLLPGDFPALFEAARDPLIWEQHPNRDRYKREIFKDFFRTALQSGGALLVLDALNLEVIGTSRFLNLCSTEVEIGYTFLVRRCWGLSFNREMKALMLNHAWRFVGEVVFVVGEQNLRSRCAVEKLGASLDPLRPREGAVRYRLSKPNLTPISALKRRIEE